MDDLDFGDLRRVVATALEEDLRYGPDATTDATIPAGETGTAAFVPRVSGVLAGTPAVLATLDAIVGNGYDVVSKQADGSTLAAGDPALVVRGPLRGLLTVERTALNLLCHLSGVATATAAWVAAVEGTGCGIRDSRKTLPGLRMLEKYAVRCGGGTNHRLGLGDAVLIKDNHVVASGSLSRALHLARTHAPELSCEVEVDDLDQLIEAMDAGADEVLLDNFTPQECVRAVHLRDEKSPGTRLEASGGLQLVDARAYAESGVDFLSVGALTHSSPALDLGMDLKRGEETENS